MRTDIDTARGRNWGSSTSSSSCVILCSSSSLHRGILSYPLKDPMSSIVADIKQTTSSATRFHTSPE
jgi:hypothetical protein